MSIALDIGVSRLRSLRQECGELIGRGVPASFAFVPDEPMVRRLLGNAGATFAAGEGELVLIGDASITYAPTFRATLSRLMPGGTVPKDDPPARQILGTLIESLIPEASQPGEPCGLILPAGAVSDLSSREFLSQLIRLRGYQPLLISSPHAAALATLSADGFTGLTLSFGAGSCSMGLIHRGRELVSVGEPRGTDWIDARLAAAGRRLRQDGLRETFLDTETVRRQRESLSDPLSRPTTEFATQVVELYRELLLATAREFAAALRRNPIGTFTAPLPVVATGGATRAAGFANLITTIFASLDLPIAVDTIRIAPADDYLVARGGLIHAELEATCAAAA